jgi:hypothetical protein
MQLTELNEQHDRDDRSRNTWKPIRCNKWKGKPYITPPIQFLRLSLIGSEHESIKKDLPDA